MCLKKTKVFPKLRQEVTVKVDFVTSDDIKIYYTGKLQDFTARYIINFIHYLQTPISLLTLITRKEKTPPKPIPVTGL